MHIYLQRISYNTKYFSGMLAVGDFSESLELPYSHRKLWPDHSGPSGLRSVGPEPIHRRTITQNTHYRITSPLLLIALVFLVGGFAAINRFGALPYLCVLDKN